MMLQKHRWLFVTSAFTAVKILLCCPVFSQELAPDIPCKRPLVLVQQQYDQALYLSAAQSARQYLYSIPDNLFNNKDADKEKASYYLTLTAIKNNIPGCADTARQFINTTVNPAYRDRVSFTLAQYYFLHDDLLAAEPLYEKAGIQNLNNTEIADEKFELAYCYFVNRQFDKATPLLAAIKELKDGKYYIAGNYYYGLLAYNVNNYKEALQSFEKIQDIKDYRAVVPYYVAEIYYFMGNRQKALAQAEKLIKAPEKTYYDKELHLLAAQCLFEDQKYKEASPYFEYYYDHADKISKENVYEIGYCDYKTGEWQKAIEKFKILNTAHDSLGQSSMYLLGDCYLKDGDKTSARNAFGMCADMTFNTKQQEAAMIMYAMLCYETGHNDEALRQLNTMLATFPTTLYKDEANTLISGLLLKTNNFADALLHLKDVTKKDDRFWQTYQKATYDFAVQEFRTGDLSGADKYFSHSLEHPVNEDYEAAACFWKGELAYDLHHPADVITYSQEFITKAHGKSEIEKISPLATIQHAYLNMGYAAMETQNYNSAQNYFSHAQDTRSTDKYADNVATLREADAVFMQKNYNKAIILYDKIIATGDDDADYATYQKSILLGLQGKNTEKIALLQLLISKEPPSSYINYARYEIAITFMESDKYTNALTYFQQLIDQASDKSFVPKALIKTGFIYQQLGDNNKAIAAYKEIVTGYPAAIERLPAMDALKSLYIQNNDPGSYAQMLKDNNLPAADNGAIDSTYYSAAENQFSSGKWNAAKDAFSSYLGQYPNGVFAIKAHYYRAESNYQLKNYKDALGDYDIVLATPWNDFSENSARHAANIAYENKDYNTAYNYYQLLRTNADDDESEEAAYSGLVKSGYNTGKYDETRKYADSLLAFHDISAETINDVLYFKAKSLQQLDSDDAAIVIYKVLSTNKNNDIAAESRYHVADILYKQNKLKEAETAANETIQLSAGSDYWIVKSYLLLADILVAEQDLFNARATLESVVKHTKIKELKEEAEKKLNELKADEKHHSKLSEE